MKSEIEPSPQAGLVRALGPIDATMIVMGSMIGSGVFITSAESARLIGAPGWLLLAWAVAIAAVNVSQSRQRASTSSRKCRGR